MGIVSHWKWNDLPFCFYSLILPPSAAKTAIRPMFKRLKWPGCVDKLLFTPAGHSCVERVLAAVDLLPSIKCYKWADNKYLFFIYYILFCSQNNYYEPWTNVPNRIKLITQNLPYFHQNSLKMFLNLTDCWKKIWQLCTLFLQNMPLTPTTLSLQQTVFGWTEIHKNKTECVWRAYLYSREILI